MSAWPGKFVIGLTGNIATGKSVVRKMLEHVGAFGIDADALANRAIQPGAPGYEPALKAFGTFLLKDNGELDRTKLGQIVFTDHAALALLESIVHPLVREALDVLVRKSKNRVVVIEAIKLLESPLRAACDVIWVTTADRARQLARLQQQRGMSLQQAELRMAAQSPQEDKVAQADTLIHNNGSIEDTWEQVKAAWKLLFPETADETVPTTLRQTPSTDGMAGFRITRARPRQAAWIADFMAEAGGRDVLTAERVMDSFGEKAYLLLQADDGLKALLGWKVENLVARVDDIHLSPDLKLEEALPFLIGEVEEASRELQCEAALLFVDQSLAAQKGLWSGLGYEERETHSLNVGAWQEAALESFEEGQVMLFKQLRADLVLRPI